MSQDVENKHLSTPLTTVFDISSRSRIAGMPREETAISEAFEIIMTCIHRQLRQLSLFHVFADNKSSNYIVRTDGLAKVGGIWLKGLCNNF